MEDRLLLFSLPIKYTRRLVAYKVRGRYNLLSMTEIEPRKEKLLENQVTIVTGGTSGIGKGIALEFAKNGANIILDDINKEHLGETAEEVRSLGVECLPVVADVAQEKERGKIIQTAMEKFGKIDILINNAGITAGKTFMRLTSKDWEKVIQTNLIGSAELARMAAKVMIDQKISGKIIFITSIHQDVIRRLPEYSTSKAGLKMLIAELGQELGPYGIRVNGIAPGSIDTRPEATKTGKPQRSEKIPLTGAAGLPEDIAKAALFLASDKWSRYITGTTITVDGGLSTVNWLAFEIPLKRPKG